MSHRTAPPEPLFYVGTGAQPLSVNRQPSIVFKRQPGLQPAIDPELLLLSDIPYLDIKHKITGCTFHLDQRESD